MSAPQEAGKAVSTIAETMRGNPLALGLLVMNALFLAFFGWLSVHVSQRNDQEREYFRQHIEKCWQFQKGGDA